MESERCFYLVWIFIILLYTITTLNAASVKENPVYSELNGKVLIKMGNNLNKPLLTLLGKTLVKETKRIEEEQAERIESVQKVLNKTVDEMKNTVERTKVGIDNEIIHLTNNIAKEMCELNKCTMWSEWSECSARLKGTFGARKRSRTCGISTSLCPSSDTERLEMDSKICQGSMCKSTYTMTKTKFCIRLSNTTKNTWDSAKDECQQDGGHLLNIDSDIKARDVNETLGKMSVSYDLWIDGTRTLPNGEWMFESEPQDPGFSNWGSGEPGSSDNCRAYVTSNSVRYWFGRQCTSAYFFLCEIF